VTDERHHRRLRPLAGLAPGGAVAPHLLDLALDGLDALPDAAAVGLELRLAGSPRADAAAEARHQRALAGEARQHVVELRQLHLEPALAAARPPGEDVEDELGAVERLAADPALEVALLGGRQLLVEEQEVDVLGLGGARDLFDLAAADERGGVPSLARSEG